MAVTALKLRPDIRQYVWGPLLVLLVGLAATGAVAWQLWRMADAKDIDRFQKHVDQTQQKLSDEMEAYAGLLRDSATLFAANRDPGSREFRAYVEHLELRKPAAGGYPQMQGSAMRYPALLGMGWIGRNTPELRERDLRKTISGNPSGPRFALKEEPGVVYAVEYLEPAEWRNQIAGDYGIFTNQASRDAMADTRDSGELTASARITMIHEFWSRSKSGFHVFLPLYRGGRASDTIPERRRKLYGFVNASLQTDELLANAHTGIAHREVGLEVFEGAQASEAAPIYRSDYLQPLLDSEHEPRLTTTAVADIAGRRWTLVFSSRPEFEAASDRNLLPTVLIIGTLISLLLASANLFQSRARSALNASEVRYRRLFEASPDGVFLFDAESGLLTDANPHMTEMLGLARDQLIGKALWEIGLFPDAELARTAFRELQQKDFYRFEQLPITTSGGQRLYADFTCNAYRTNGKRVMQCNVRNISDRKRAEDALRDSEERYRNLVEVSPQGVWIASRDGALLYINRHWVEYSGMSFQQSAGAGWSEQVYPEDRERMREGWLHALLHGTMFEAEVRLRRAVDGEYRWHLARGIPLRDESGHVERWLGVFIDIHERKQTEQERTQLLAREQALRSEAEAANRAKDDFLATLSHELRTPLNAILGWTQTLQGGNTPKDLLLRALAQIEASANAQAKLINDLLNVADIGAGRLRLEIQAVQLIPLIETVVEALTPAIAAREIDFETDLDPDANQMSGDPARLQQIIWNLLSNAVKFTPRGGSVRLTLRRMRSQIELAVSDTGEGISPDFLPFVFDRFRQADPSIKRRHGGLGLGLSIVRHLTELHGGSVIAQSGGEGLGARFCVQLPIQALHQSVVEAADPAKRVAVFTPVSVQPNRLRLRLAELRILSVDDDPSTREMLHEALERSGAIVTSAASAREALAALNSERPDVLVSDIGLPEEDGYDLIRQVRALAPNGGGSTPAVALTGYARAQDQQAILAAGYQAFIAKPVNLNALIEIIVSLGKKS